MVKSIFAAIVFVHGVIHLLGVVKAFRPTRVRQLRQPISRSTGIVWAVVSLLFIASATLLVMNDYSWTVLAGLAVVLSQILIIGSWTDAKAGTILNVLVIIPVIITWIGHSVGYSVEYRTETERRLCIQRDTTIVTEADIAPLPKQIQKYLRFAGVVGKPRISNTHIVSVGTMRRSLNDEWMDITARQYDFFDGDARIFYIQSSLFGIPFDGLHLFTDDSASMQIAIASIFPVVDARGDTMTHSETVTFFNDMCLFAPSSLISKHIQWRQIDSLTIDARFANGANVITATLCFDTTGALVNFISDDRSMTDDGNIYRRYRWTTPVKQYAAIAGRNVPVYAEAIWGLPEGNFLYARYKTVSIDYNCRTFIE